MLLGTRREDDLGPFGCCPDSNRSSGRKPASSSASLRVATEFLPRPDVRVSTRALLQRSQARGDWRKHPRAVQALLNEIPLLHGIIDQVEHERPLWLDDRSTGAFAVPEHDLHRFPLDRHHARVGTEVDHVISSGCRVLPE